MKVLLKNLFYQVSKPALGKLNKFYKAHIGESGYIFGDGISIKYMDLTRFTDKESIAVNYFLLHKNFHKLKCSHCVLSSPFFFNPYLGYESKKRYHMNKMAKIYSKIISEKHLTNFFLNLSNFPYVTGKNVHFMFNKVPDNRLGYDFIANQIDCYAGVDRTAVMLAIYMGFSKIHLVGFDYTHNPSRDLHWYEKGPGIISSTVGYNDHFYKIANEFIDITTITLDGLSTHLNYITYKDYTGLDPHYLENTELAKTEYLTALSTWPGYKIY